MFSYNVRVICLNKEITCFVSSVAANKKVRKTRYAENVTKVFFLLESVALQCVIIKFSGFGASVWMAALFWVLG